MLLLNSTMFMDFIPFLYPGISLDILRMIVTKLIIVIYVIANNSSRCNSNINLILLVEKSGNKFIIFLK